MDRSKISILLVEQSGMMTSVIVSLLHELKYDKIKRVVDAKSAQKEVQTGKFDLIICDWYPKANSVLELLRSLRQSEMTRDLPFVMVSGIIEHDAVEKAVALGVDEYIVKPFTIKLFEQKINHAMHSKRRSISRSRRVEHNEIAEFQSKIVVCIDDQHYSEELQKQLEGQEYIRLSSLEQGVQQANADKLIDIILVDESTASHEQPSLNKALELCKLGQIEMVFLSPNTCDKHITALNKLGIRHIINSQTSLYDVSHRLDLLTTIKKAMLHTNRSVRRAESERKQDGEVQSNLAKSVMDKSGSIRALSEQISSHTSASRYITELSDEITQNSITINSLANAIHSVHASLAAGSDMTYEDINLRQTIDHAELIFQSELKARKIAVEYNTTEFHRVNVNPTLFNSLFMFLMKAFIKDVLFGTPIVIHCQKHDDKNELEVTFSLRFPSLPHLNEITDHVLLREDGSINIVFKHAIQQLIDTQVLEMQYVFDIATNSLSFSQYFRLPTE